MLPLVMPRCYGCIHFNHNVRKEMDEQGNWIYLSSPCGAINAMYFDAGFGGCSNPNHSIFKDEPTDKGNWQYWNQLKVDMYEHEERYLDGEVIDPDGYVIVEDYDEPDDRVAPGDCRKCKKDCDELSVNCPYHAYNTMNRRSEGRKLVWSDNIYKYRGVLQCPDYVSKKWITPDAYPGMKLRKISLITDVIDEILGYKLKDKHHDIIPTPDQRDKFELFRWNLMYMWDSSDVFNNKYFSPKRWKEVCQLIMRNCVGQELPAPDDYDGKIIPELVRK